VCSFLLNWLLNHFDERYLSAIQKTVRQRSERKTDESGDFWENSSKPLHTSDAANHIASVLMKVLSRGSEALEVLMNVNFDESVLRIYNRSTEKTLKMLGLVKIVQRCP
jgi:hypothetical protein